MRKVACCRVAQAALLALLLGCGRAPVEPDRGSPAGWSGPFLFALNGEFPENDFLQNAVVFETPFMTMEYERKHALDNAGLIAAANFQWARQIRRDRPTRRIILRYNATTWGKVPASFDQYLAAETATLRRFLALARREGVSFDLAEFTTGFLRADGTAKPSYEVLMRFVASID
jgi:hypothetical protein